MSLFMSVNLVCPSCSNLIVMEAVGSVNADRRPDLRDDIMNNDFQDVSCGKCDETFRLQPNFNYLDAGRGQWIAGLPASNLSEFQRIEEEVTALFDQSYGANAPAAAQAVGNDLEVRLTFGWPALREKLLVREHQLDDVTLELMKLDLMRRVPEAPFGDDMELRLVECEGDLLSFVWFDSATEAAKLSFAARRALYDEIAEAPDTWSAMRARVSDSAFVDFRKLYLAEERAA